MAKEKHDLDSLGEIFDKRLVQRNIQKKYMTTSDYDAHLKKLTDDSKYCDFVELDELLDSNKSEE